MSEKRASNSAGPGPMPYMAVGICPLRCCSDWPRVGGVGGGGTGGAILDVADAAAAAADVAAASDEAEEVERWGSGGGGGGIDGARHGGGGGATLVIGAPLLVVLPLGPRDVGGDGGRCTGGLKIRFVVGLCWGSFRQSCDWCKEDGVGASTGGDRGSRILCAL